MPAMTIGTLAREGGVGVETVRYYQRRGLLPEPARSGGVAGVGGVRRYGDDDARRLRFIRAAKTAGFTLEEIRDLLALDTVEDRSKAREMARTRIAALEERIADLQRARNALARLADRCGNDSEGPCPILSAFEGD